MNEIVESPNPKKKKNVVHFWYGTKDKSSFDDKVPTSYVQLFFLVIIRDFQNDPPTKETFYIIVWHSVFYLYGKERKNETERDEWEKWIINDSCSTKLYNKRGINDKRELGNGKWVQLLKQSNWQNELTHTHTKIK